MACHKGCERGNDEGRLGDSDPLRDSCIRGGQEGRREAWCPGQDHSVSSARGLTEGMDSEYAPEVKPKGLADVKREGKGEIKIDS